MKTTCRKSCESFGGVTFDIILCMSHFNHVPSGDTLRRDAISSSNLTIKQKAVLLYFAFG